MNNIEKFYHSFIKTSSSKKKKVIIIVALTIKTSIIIHTCPLKKYINTYFKYSSNHGVDLNPFMDDINLIKKVLKKLPGKHTCLKESIIVHLFFKSKGVVIPIFLGISLKPQMQAHAWYDIREENGFTKLVIQNGEKNI